MLGFASWLIGRAGVRPKLPRGYIFRSVFVVICIIEVTAASLGAFSYTTGRTVFPENLYRDLFHTV